MVRDAARIFLTKIIDPAAGETIIRLSAMAPGTWRENPANNRVRGAGRASVKIVWIRADARCAPADVAGQGSSGGRAEADAQVRAVSGHTCGDGWLNPS